MKIPFIGRLAKRKARQLKIEDIARRNTLAGLTPMTPEWHVRRYLLGEAQKIPGGVLGQVNFPELLETRKRVLQLREMLVESHALEIAAPFSGISGFKPKSGKLKDAEARDAEMRKVERKTGIAGLAGELAALKTIQAAVRKRIPLIAVVHLKAVMENPELDAGVERTRERSGAYFWNDTREGRVNRLLVRAHELAGRPPEEAEEFMRVHGRGISLRRYYEYSKRGPFHQ